MQTFNNIANSETGLSVRGKLNNALTSIISGSEGINAIWAKINSVINMVNAMEGGIGGLVKDTSYDPASLDTYKSAVLIALCTGTFYKLKDKNGTPITIPGSNALTIFYRAANTTYWEYDTQEIFPAVDSYESNDYSKIGSAKTHVMTHSGNNIKPMTDFNSVYDLDGNNLTKTVERLHTDAKIVLASMGTAVDNEGNNSEVAIGYVPSVGDRYYDTATGHIKWVKSSTVTEDLGLPSEDRIYCNMMTKRLYVFKNGWKKVDKIDIVQSTGTSTTSVMSQKAVSDAINKLKNTGYLYAGIATPTTNPGTPDGPVFYIATQAGVYSNFNGIEVGDEVSILKWNNGTWDKIPTNIATAGNSVHYEYLANSGKDYPIIYAEDIPESNSVRKAINSLLLKAKIVRSNDRSNVNVQLCYINRTSTTEGQFDNAIQLHIWEGDAYKGIKTYKNPAMVIGTTGVKDISFYDPVYKFELILTLDLDKSANTVIWNETTNEMYQKTPFDDLCYEPLDKNVNDYVSSNSSKYFGYDINSGKDYPMEFTDDAPPRDGSTGSTLGLHLNNVLKNIRVFTEDVEKANKWSYELSYINRTVDHTGAFPNTFGFTRRNRETKAIDTTFYAQKLDALLNGDTDFEYAWEIDGDIVIFTLDCSKAPVGTPLTISNYPLSEKPNTYSERQWLNKKQYFYMGKIPKITGIVNPMSILNVSVEGETVYIASKISRTTDIIYQFQKCMFNSLFTFYRVGFVENSSAYPNVLNRNSVTWVNITSSDNIGPMYIRNAGWCGANHSWKEEGVVHTAKNNSFAIYSNGKILQDRDNIFTDNAEIRVENTIYNPAIAPEDEGATILTSPLCTESVVYRISGNSIQVILNHKFINEEAVTIAKYYGMQSMFIGEDKILTSNGKYPNWTNVVEDGMSFNKASYPKFNRFVEHNSNNNTYQSTYLRSYGLGDHNQIGSSSFMFIKSGAKAYHYLIDSIQYSSGMSHNWSGLYSWFKQPILDDDNFFVYEGKIDGHDLVFIDIKMLSIATKIKLPDKYVLKDFTIIQKDDVVTIGENIDVDGLEISSTNSGSVILKF